MAARGALLYLADTGSQFGVYNLLANGLDGTLALATSVDIMAVDGNYAYVGAGSRIYAIDVEDTTTPTLLGAGTPPNYVPRTGVVIGDRLAVLEDRYITLFDIPDPTLIVEAGRIEPPQFTLYTPLGKVLLRVGDFLHAGRRHTSPGGATPGTSTTSLPS